MNSLLAQKEKEQQKRCCRIYEIYKLVKNDGDIDDFEIGIIVEFNTSATMRGPKYFLQHFIY